MGAVDKTYTGPMDTVLVGGDDGTAPVLGSAPPIEITTPFLIESYTLPGASVSFGTGTVSGNKSGVTWIPDADGAGAGRLGVIRNNSSIVFEFSPTNPSVILREVTLSHGGYSDTEGLYYNAATNEMFVASEAGGGYRIHIYDWVKGNSNTTISMKQSLVIAETPVENNSGAEGIAYRADIETNGVFYVVGEGEQSGSERRLFRVVRPTNENTNYTYADPELVVDELTGAEARFPGVGGSGTATFDLCDCYLAPNNHLLVMSQIGKKIIQIDPEDLFSNYNTSPTHDATAIPIISELSFSSIASSYQWEGMCLYGDNNDLALVAETERLILAAGPRAPVITQPPNAEIDILDTFSYTPSVSQGANLYWFLEYGPDEMSVNPLTGEISWVPLSMPRGQGFLIGIGCCNHLGEDIKWFVIHVDNITTSKLRVMGTYYADLGITLSNYIRSAAAQINSGDTLVVPSGTYQVSVNSSSDYLNGFTNALTYPAGTSAQLTSIIAQNPTNTVITGAPYASLARQGSIINLGQNSGDWVKFSGIECTKNNRQAITSEDNSAHTLHIYMDLMGATDCGYNVDPRTYQEASDGSYSSVAAGYLGDNAVWHNSYAFGQFRYGLQFGNPALNCIHSRNIVRPDDYHGSQPRGGIVAYSTSYYLSANNIVIDADKEEFAPFYSYEAGCFACPATGSEGVPVGHVFKSNLALNCDMVGFSSDHRTSSISDMDGCVFAEIQNTVTPRMGYVGPTFMNTKSLITVDKCVFIRGKTHENAQMTGTNGAFRCGSTVSQYPTEKVIDIADSIIGYFGWNEDTGATFDAGPVFNATGTSALCEVTGSNISNYGGLLEAVAVNYDISGTTTLEPLANGLDYLPKVTEGSPLEALDPDLTKFKSKAYRFHGDTGYNSEPTMHYTRGNWCWPHPAEGLIRAKMKAYYKTNCVTRASSPGGTDFGVGTISGDRGFCADGESLSEYIWGYLGKTVPPLRTCAIPRTGGEVTFFVAKYRSSRGNGITKYKIYREGTPDVLIATVYGPTTLINVAGESAGEHTYYITAVDPSKSGAYGADEAGESQPGRRMTVTVT